MGVQTETLLAALFRSSHGRVTFSLPATAATDEGSSPSATSSTPERPVQCLGQEQGRIPLSSDEVKGISQEKDFARLDKDSDGKLSQREYAGEKAVAGATGGAESSGAAGSTAPRTGGTPKQAALSGMSAIA